MTGVVPPEGMALHNAAVVALLRLADRIKNALPSDEDRKTALVNFATASNLMRWSSSTKASVLHDYSSLAGLAKRTADLHFDSHVTKSRGLFAFLKHGSAAVKPAYLHKIGFHGDDGQLSDDAEKEEDESGEDEELEKDEDVDEEEYFVCSSEPLNPHCTKDRSTRVTRRQNLERLAEVGESEDEEVVTIMSGNATGVSSPSSKSASAPREIRSASPRLKDEPEMDMSCNNNIENTQGLNLLATAALQRNGLSTERTQDAEARAVPMPSVECLETTNSEFFFCVGVPLNFHCTKNRSTSLLKHPRHRGVLYCQSCADWLKNKQSHLKAIGCSNPYNRASCGGKESTEYRFRNMMVLCSSCRSDVTARHNNIWPSGAAARKRDESAPRSMIDQDVVVVESSRMSALPATSSSHELSQPPETTQIASVAAQESSRRRSSLRSVSSSTTNPQLRSATPGPSRERPHDRDAADLKSTKVPQPAPQYTKAEDKISLDATLPSPKAIKLSSEERQQARKTTSQTPTATSETSRDRSSLTGISIQSTNLQPRSTTPAPSRKRAHDQEGLEPVPTKQQTAPSNNATSSAKRQRVFDEQQNTIEFRMRPSQIEKARQNIWKLIEDTALNFFTMTGCDAAKSVAFVPFGNTETSLSRLYLEVFSNDPFRVLYFEAERSLSGYHVLLALLGRIVSKIMTDEALPASCFPVGMAKESIAKQIELFGHDVEDFVKRCEYTHVTSSAFAEEKIKPQARSLAVKWTQTLLPHLELIVSKTRVASGYPRAFGSGLEAALKAALLLQARLLVAGEYSPMWPRADKLVDSTMEELNPSKDATNVAVKMALLPAIMKGRDGREVICKAKVYCHVLPKSG